LLHTVREAFPEKVRTRIVAVDTVHSYKGKEGDAIVVVDAVERSYPLMHPDNVFYEILGQTLQKTIADERHLFYVAASRAIKSLVFVTDGISTTPFLPTDHLRIVDWGTMPAPQKQGDIFDKHTRVTTTTLYQKASATRQSVYSRIT